MSHILLVIALLFELDVALTLLRGPPGWLPWLAALLLHLSAAGMCAEALHRRLPLLTTLGVCALLPALGPLAALLLSLPPRLRQAAQGAASSWEEARQKAADAAAERRRGQQRIGAEIEPIIDSIRDEDPEVRVAAIEALQREMSPRAVRLLQEAQRDPVFEVKLRATEALAAIAKAQAQAQAQAQTAQDRERSRRLDELELLLARRDYAGLAAACARLKREGGSIDAIDAIDSGAPESAEAIYFWAGWKDPRARR